MSKENYTYDDFIKIVTTEDFEAVKQINDLVIANKGVCKVTEAKNGYLVSYSDKNKRVLLNFIFRKSGLIARIYGDGINKYENYLETLPKNMIASIVKAPDCKELIVAGTCNPKCRKGYQFSLSGVVLQKCQYNCFMFLLNEENNNFIREFVSKEMQARQ